MTGTPAARRTPPTVTSLVLLVLGTAWLWMWDPGTAEPGTAPLSGEGRAKVSEPIVYVDNSEIRPGRREELEAAIAELARFVEANEPRILAYNAYFSEDGTRMTVVHVHPDAASLAFHMQVAGPRFARFAELVQMVRIDIYGEPSPEVVDRLRQKAAMLGSGEESVQVHGRRAGFARFMIH